MKERLGPDPCRKPEYRGPRLGRRMARFNRLITNRLTLRAAGRLPGLGIIIHTGRRSGRIYRTPVGIFASRDSFVVALTYGRHSQWVQNVLAAGGCRLISRGQHYSLTDPEVFHDERPDFVPLLPRMVLTAVRVSDFLRLRAANDQSVPSVGTSDDAGKESAPVAPDCA